MLEFYYQAAREGAMRKALEDVQNKQEAVEKNAKGFSTNMEAMEKRLKEFSGYRESEHFKLDTVAHVVENPRKAADALCSEEASGRKVIQGFFDSPAMNCQLLDALSWDMAIEAAHMQRQF